MLKSENIVRNATSDNAVTFQDNVSEDQPPPLSFTVGPH